LHRSHIVGSSMLEDGTPGQAREHAAHVLRFIFL